MSCWDGLRLGMAGARWEYKKVRMLIFCEWAGSWIERLARWAKDAAGQPGVGNGWVAVAT